MDGRAILLHAHVVAPSQDLAICRHQACSDGHATLTSTLLGLLESGFETFVCGGHLVNLSCWLNFSDYIFRGESVTLCRKLIMGYDR